MARTREEVVAVFDRVIETHPEIERKGKANPYCSCQGHMFAMVGQCDRLGVRLSKEDWAEFRSEFGEEDFV